MSADPTGPDPSPPDRPPAVAAAPEPSRRSRVTILLSFLGAFLLLLVVFRAVLFPFLIAMFIAYLIEPVVAAFTRAPVFGVRWTRGPTIVLMYAVVLTSIVLTTSCAVTSISATVKEVSRDVGKALAEKGEAAAFELEGGTLEQDLRLPAGTRVVLRPSLTHAGPVEGAGAPPTGPVAPPAPAAGPVPAPAAAEPALYATYHEAVLHAGESSVRVILKALAEPVPAGQEPGAVLHPDTVTLADGGALPADRLLRVRNAAPAKGLELWLEKNLIGPIVKNLAAVGYKAEPTELREFIGEKAEALGADIGQRVTAEGKDFAISLIKSLYVFLLILMLTAFIVMDRKGISAFFASLPPDHLKAEYGKLIRYVDQGLAGVIRGQLVICAVNGVLTWVGLVLLGVQGATMLAFVAGLLSLIPIFGTIVSSIPIVLVAATDGIGTGALALGWIGFIHLLEANLLNPMIMGSHANMHPVVIVFALLAGEHAYGAWGALLAVPTMSILQSCFRFYRHEIEGLPQVPGKSHGEWLHNLLRRLKGRGAPPTAGAHPG